MFQAFPLKKSQNNSCMPKAIRSEQWSYSCIKYIVYGLVQVAWQDETAVWSGVGYHGVINSFYLLFLNENHSKHTFLNWWVFQLSFMVIRIPAEWLVTRNPKLIVSLPLIGSDVIHRDSDFLRAAFLRFSSFSHCSQNFPRFSHLKMNRKQFWLSLLRGFAR